MNDEHICRRTYLGFTVSTLCFAFGTLSNFVIGEVFDGVFNAIVTLVMGGTTWMWRVNWRNQVAINKMMRDAHESLSKEL